MGNNTENKQNLTELRTENISFYQYLVSLGLFYKTSTLVKSLSLVLEGGDPGPVLLPLVLRRVVPLGDDFPRA